MFLFDVDYGLLVSFFLFLMLMLVPTLPILSRASPKSSISYAMAHPANKEVAHRQQFYFWKNFRNSRLKRILRWPLPEPATAPPTSAPPALLPTSVAPPAAPPPAPSPVTAAALSPMQYAIPPGFGLAKTGPRNASVDRRKRKKDG